MAAGQDPADRPRGRVGRAETRRLIIAVATLAWVVVTVLPLITNRIDPVPEMGPAFLAFLGAYIAVPHLGKRGGKDDE